MMIMMMMMYNVVGSCKLTYGVQFAMYNLRCTLSVLRCAMHDAQKKTYGVNVESMKSAIIRMTYDV